ncbi:MAG TPA: DNA helicase RecG, partial [Elusimicrobiota bacterium]|nr:DNA helicase RecG [Elusimicrobiota bacterium]
DGFEIAENDLKLRGPGEFLGESQHGLPPLKVGNIVRDGALIEEAREAAFQLITTDSRLKKEENRPFLQELRARFGTKLAFGQVA